MAAIAFTRQDFCEYRNICVAIKQLRAELLDIKNRCTVVDTVQDYSTGYARTIRIESVLQDRYLKQAAATEAAILELEQRRDIIYRTITTACGQIDMRMYSNVLMYIIRGYSMDRISMANNCSQATVSRDVQSFFRECSRFYLAVVGNGDDEGGDAA